MVCFEHFTSLFAGGSFFTFLASRLPAGPIDGGRATISTNFSPGEATVHRGIRCVRVGPYQSCTSACAGCKAQADFVPCRSSGFNPNSPCPQFEHVNRTGQRTCRGDGVQWKVPCLVCKPSRSTSATWRGRLRRRTCSACSRPTGLSRTPQC